MSRVREGIYVETAGPLEANCFLVALPGSNMLYVIDPGADAEEIVAAAGSLGLARAMILLTHGHVDHISAVGDVAKALKAKVFLHPGDAGLYSSPNNHLMPFVPPAQGLPETSWPPPAGDVEWLHTPGHTKGGVCYHFPKLNAIFSGDTLFRGSIGRTDFPGGDLGELLASIRNVLFKFPDSTELFPGHGPSTSVGVEKSMNPYAGEGAGE